MPLAFVNALKGSRPTERGPCPRRPSCALLPRTPNIKGSRNHGSNEIPRPTAGGGGIKEGCGIPSKGTSFMPTLLRFSVALFLFAPQVFAQESRASQAAPAGVVCKVRVVSNNVPDVTTMEAWKNAFIKDGMSDEEKAMAIWKTVAMFQHQDSGVMECLHNEDMLTDAMKVIHVYGHSYCGMAAAHAIELARYVGLEARGWTINTHVVPEIKWDNAWHLLDPSLILYFPKAAKTVAAVEEIIARVKAWYATNPDYWG